MRVSGFALLMAALAACGGEGEPHAGSTLRLERLLSAARIESPLQGSRGVSDLSELAPGAASALLSEDFTAFEVERRAGAGLPGARAVEEGGNRFLQVATIGWKDTLGWVFPARSDAFYRFGRSIRLHGDAAGDVYLVESRLPPSEDSVEPLLNRLSGRGAALRIHSLPQQPHAEAGAVWQTQAVTFQPSPHTRSLIVLLRPSSEEEALIAGAPLDLDDVRLEELVPTPQQRTALLQAADLALGSDLELGMVKEGLLLPLPAADSAVGRELESNYTWLRALYAPPPTTLEFELELPKGARLRLATGLSRASPPGSAAAFEVDLLPDERTAPQRLLEQRLEATATTWRWHEHDLDLGAFAGRQVRLVLRTRALAGDPHPLWGDPRIDGTPKGTPPLLILIAVDTLRADRLGCYGHTRPTSPNLDRLAAEGVRFASARANANWTCPSFASIFTGLVPSRHGVLSYGPATPLPQELSTLAERLREQGWSTHSIAYKVPLYEGGYEQGFDLAFNAPRDVVRGEENLAWAMDWLERRGSAPAFLFLHFNDPHVPYKQPEPFDRVFGPPPESIGRTLPLSISDPRGSATPEPLRQLVDSLYDGSVAYVDHCIGRFLDALRERGLYEKATLAFVSDHGEQLWEHGRFGHGEEGLWEEVVRVPLMVKPPAGTFTAGRVVETHVRAFDLMPTLLELGGLSVPAGLDARSLVPLLRGEAQELGVPSVVEASSGSLAVVEGNWKYVLALGDGGSERLFDLSRESAEHTDLARERPLELERLRRLAAQYLVEHRPGAYVVVRAGEDALVVRAVGAALRPLVGAPRLEAGPGGTTLELPPATWALLGCEDVDALEFEGLPGAAATPPRESADLARCLETPGPAAWSLKGPERAAVEARGSLDLEQLEALRRLGYVK